MPAQSQQQQKLFGLALAFKRGEVKSSEVSDEIKGIADRMSEKEIEDFAKTTHKGLPKMKEQLRKIVREIMREKAISEMNEVSINEVDTKKANQIRKAAAGYVGPKFAKKASDEDILVMADLKDEKAKIYNRYLKDIMGKISKLQKKYNIKESVNEGKKSKDSTGVRKAEAIHNNVDTIIDLVLNDRKDAKEILGTMGPVLINAIKATLKHKFKPAAGNEDSLKKFQSKLKDFLKFTEVLLRKPSKAGVKRLETMHREWWNWNHGADVVLNGRLKDTIIESVNEKYNGNARDFKYDFEMALDNMGISGKAIKKISKKGKGYEVRLSSYMSDKNTWEKIGKSIGADLVDFTKGSINIGLYESVINEGYSTEEKRIVMMAVRKLSKYRSVPIDQSINDLLGAGAELQRDIKKGKIKK